MSTPSRHALLSYACAFVLASFEIGMLSPRRADACSCSPPPPIPASVWPPGGQAIPRNPVFSISLGARSAPLMARIVAGGFPPPHVAPYCAPGDPFCKEDTLAEPPVKRYPHPPERWTEPMPELRAFLWRFPASRTSPELVEADAHADPFHHEIELVPRELLEPGMHYEIALGPTPEQAFPWAAYVVTDEIDHEPPSWTAEPDVHFSPEDSERLGSCAAGGVLTSTLAPILDGPATSRRPSRLWIEALWEGQPEAVVPAHVGTMTLGVKARCEETPMVMPRRGPFLLRFHPVDIAGNHGQTYEIQVDEHGGATVTSVLATRGESRDRADAGASTPLGTTQEGSTSRTSRTPIGWLLLGLGIILAAAFAGWRSTMRR